MEGGGGGLDREVDGHEEGSQHHRQAPAYQREQHILLGEGAVPGCVNGGGTLVRISWCWGAVGGSMWSRGPG